VRHCMLPGLLSRFWQESGTSTKRDKILSLRFK
jgi:hypothetical protein